MSIAIQAVELAKKYHIAGARPRGYATLRETIARGVVAPFRRAARLLGGQATGAAGLEEVLWALDDVSFSIEEGEAVGIIGRNGAGKSTLLKILSGITEPTRGHVDLSGRVGALLEVGTGFHPELTGRENIYLNGAILGMTAREVDRKFDQILGFAEVERFVDTPVKHYSSGMGLRLGFAVAAHLEPEILLIDEVLAVGDVGFQKKCLGKMNEVTRQGRTVLFVSHNLPAVVNLTERAIWLDQGRIRGIGPTRSVVSDYLDSVDETPVGRRRFVPDDAPLPSRSRVRSITLLQDGHPTTVVPMGGSFEFEVVFSGQEELAQATLGLGIDHLELGRVLSLSTRLVGCDGDVAGARSGTFRCHVDEAPLNQGTYLVTIQLSDGRRDIERIEEAIRFDITAADVFGTGAGITERQGVAFARHSWSFDRGD